MNGDKMYKRFEKYRTFRSRLRYALATSKQRSPQIMQSLIIILAVSPLKSLPVGSLFSPPPLHLDPFLKCPQPSISLDHAPQHHA